jgi:hypothetical protein
LKAEHLASTLELSYIQFNSKEYIQANAFRTQIDNIGPFAQLLPLNQCPPGTTPPTHRHITTPYNKAMPPNIKKNKLIFDFFLNLSKNLTRKFSFETLQIFKNSKAFIPTNHSVQHTLVTKVYIIKH